MNRFFINYSVGARGDFLTNCLRDVEYDIELVKDLKNNAKMPPPLSYCVKTHGDIKDIFTEIKDFPKNYDSLRDLFDTVNSFNLIKLKIVTSSIEECIDTVWFAYTKTILNNTRLIPKLSPNVIPEPTLELELAASNATINPLLTEFGPSYNAIIYIPNLDLNAL